LQVRFRLRQVAGVERAEEAPVAGVEKIGGPQPVQGQAPGREVAAPRGQIFGQVAQDVDHLQSLAEADGVREQPPAVKAGAGVEAAQAEPGPELPHAAGDPVGVVFQLLVRSERRDPVRSGRTETPEVRVLAGGDDLEDRGDLGAVLRAEAAQFLQQRAEAREQAQFPRRGGAGACDRPEVGGAHAPALADVPDGDAHGGEELAAAPGGDRLRVGDRVGGPGEEVGKAQLGFDGAREDGERQVKGAGHLPQQALEVRRSGHDGGIEPQNGVRGEMFLVSGDRALARASPEGIFRRSAMSIHSER